MTDTVAAVEQQAADPRGMRTFLVIWSGQLVSLIGSGLTNFAIGFYVLDQTESATAFAFVLFFAMLPTIVLSPIAGALVDRWDRRIAMIVSDAGAGLATLFMLLMLNSGGLEVWHVYVAVAFSAASQSFQWPAYSAVTTLLVPKKHLGRASGMTQMAEAISQLIAPAIAGVLYFTIGVRAVITIDFITFLIAVTTLAIVRVPKPETTDTGEESQGNIFQEARFGFQWILKRPGLLGLLMFFALYNFVWSIVNPLILPLARSMATVQVIGIASSVVGVGMLIGTVIMSAWGGPKQRVLGVIGSGVVAGVGVMIMGLRANIYTLVTGGVLMMIVMPILGGSSQALWQVKTPPDIQGRVFSIRRMMAWALILIAFPIAGPLADFVFEPAMAEGGVLAPIFGPLIGVGEGRGIGLMFLVSGALIILTSVVFYFSPRVRNVQQELPDYVSDVEESEEEASEVETAPQTVGEAVPAGK